MVFYSQHKMLILASAGVAAVAVAGTFLVRKYASPTVKKTIEKGKDAVVSKLARGNPVVSPTPLSTSAAPRQPWNPIGSMWEDEEAVFQSVSKLDEKK